MTNEMLLNGLLAGHPLQVVETGEMVFFRSARFSPHAEEVLVIVADEAGGVFSVTCDDVDFMHYEEDDDCACSRCVPRGAVA